MLRPYPEISDRSHSPPPVMIRTTAIRRFKAFCIVTNCLSMNAATRQRNCLISRFTNAARRIQKPVVEGFMRWLDAQCPEKGSRMDRAITYIRNRKDTLMTYLEDGRCSLSNNPSENSIRPLTLGRKNWLFSDSQYGANASMVVYTMVEMAKAHELHPYNYLQYLLDSRPGKDTTTAELQDLAPWSEKARIECNKKSE